MDFEVEVDEDPLGSSSHEGITATICFFRSQLCFYINTTCFEQKVTMNPIQPREKNPDENKTNRALCRRTT
jgi:hypothetical protein